MPLLPLKTAHQNSNSKDNSKKVFGLRDGRPITDLRQFMRAELAASNKILEGLTTDDMTLTLEGARTLNKMCRSVKWRVNNTAMDK